MAMQIDFAAINGRVNTRICFSPDVLCYMQIKNNNAEIPKKYQNTAEAEYFLQIYSERINKNLAWAKEHGPAINYKKLTGVDVDDYPEIKSQDMYVGGASFNLYGFNFPNGVTHPYISHSPIFNGVIGYSDMAYNFSEMFANCYNFCNIFGYPKTVTGPGYTSNWFYAFRNHYTNREKEIAEYNLNYRKINDQGVFPGYNCSNMFLRCIYYRPGLIPMSDTMPTDGSAVRRQYQVDGINRLNYVMLRDDGVTPDGPAINDASNMFASANIDTSTGYNYDIYVNNAENMYVNCNMNAAYIKVNAFISCENMFAWSNIKGNPAIDIDNCYSMSLAYMFAYSSVNPSSQINIDSSIRNTSHMFSQCKNFNQFVNVEMPVSIPDPTLFLQDMSYMFFDCNKFNYPVNISNTVTNTSHMFSHCKNFNQSVYVNSGVGDSSDMFSDCSNLNSPIHIATSDLMNAYSMFDNAGNNYPYSARTSLIVTIDSTHIGNAVEMFQCSRISQGPVFTNVIDIDIASNMFSRCHNMVNINMHNVSVNNASYMFAYCSSLNDITFNDDGYHINYAYSLFHNCQQINNSAIKPFGARITAELLVYDEMFADCNSLDDLHLYDRSYAANNYRAIVRYNASRLLNVYLHCEDDRSVVESEMTAINSKRDVMPVNTTVGAADFGHINNAWTTKPTGIYADNNYPIGCWRDTRYNINLYLVPDM